MTFEQFYANWYSYVRAVSYGSLEDRDEIVQEVFMTAWTQQKIPLDQMPARWLAKVTRWRSYKFYKPHGGARLKPLSLDQERQGHRTGVEGEIWTLGAMLAAPAVDFDPSAADRLGARLSVRELDVVTRSADGYTDVEISRVLGLSAQRIGSIKRDAAALLQGTEEIE